MANPTMVLTRHLGKIGVDRISNLLSRTTHSMAQEAHELMAEESTGSGWYADDPCVLPYGCGHWKLARETRLGGALLRVPKLCEDDYLPSLLGPRGRGERAPVAITQAAYVQGGNTHKGDEPLRAPGSMEIGMSDVSRICQELDDPVGGLRGRPSHGAYHYALLDELCMKVRQKHGIISRDPIVSIRMRGSLERETLGIGLGAGEEGAPSVDFLRSLVHRARPAAIGQQPRLWRNMRRQSDMPTTGAVRGTWWRPLRVATELMPPQDLPAAHGCRRVPSQPTSGGLRQSRRCVLLEDRRVGEL
jgi:hypothetical protein